MSLVGLLTGESHAANVRWKGFQALTLYADPALIEEL